MAEIRYRDDNGNELYEVKSGRNMLFVGIMLVALDIAIIVMSMVNKVELEASSSMIIWALMVICAPLYVFLYYINRRVWYNEDIIIIRNLFGKKYSMKYYELSRVTVNKSFGIQFYDENGRHLTNIGLEYKGVREMLEMLEDKGVTITRRNIL